MNQRSLKIASGILYLSLLGCAGAPATGPSISGSFTGTTGTGQTLVLTLQEDGGGFSGRGTLDGIPLVVSGARTWTGVAALTHADGSSELVEMHLSADSDRLRIDSSAQPPVALQRGGAPLATLPGPFSGRYRAMQGQVPMAELTVLQSGNLISGAGQVLGEPAGLAGRVTGPDRAKGFILFGDRSRAGFSAELSADRSALTVRGLGAPTLLHKE